MVKQRLSIDWGEKRVGLAIGVVLAKEYGSFPNNADLLTKLQHVIVEEEVGEVIVGSPVRSGGEPGTHDVSIKQFVQDLTTGCPEVKVITLNEAYTSTQARLELEEAGIPQHETDLRIDQYSAKLLLDQYNREHPVKL